MHNFYTRTDAEAALQPGQMVADHGASVWPRYSVFEPPKVGDAVSYGFNGDYYPDGTVVRVGKNYRTITTSTGHTYWRRKETARWLQTGGTWCLVRGRRDERNPHF